MTYLYKGNLDKEKRPGKVKNDFLKNISIDSAKPVIIQIESNIVDLITVWIYASEGNDYYCIIDGICFDCDLFLWFN